MNVNFKKIFSHISEIFAYIFLCLILFALLSAYASSEIVYVFIGVICLGLLIVIYWIYKNLIKLNEKYYILAVIPIAILIHRFTEIFNLFII